ncbi:hypothetical protein KVR01_005470 [Diaporthe batatas]|uniref:uncharacterized protein n=1 Tax=Diaporthe batatas TaxID=748121 RepID=UPI001D03D8C4|nr:uncharacterized protein KVR01_005470 [Diaporthe batatas]KAG8165195.1 hypothetical protein KVR01_005470 [Diaporthe batatas]
MSDEDDPSSPTSPLSKKARLAHWITGGTNRGPSTMSSFIRMTRDRNDIKKATKAWSLAGERALDEHQSQWGASRPKGAALIRWYREGGGGGGGTHEANRGDAVQQPEMQQRGRQGQGEAAPVEDDIYRAGDNTLGQRAEGGNTGDGGTITATATGEGGDDR